MISTMYAQNLLDELCCKVNRRNYGDQTAHRMCDQFK